MTYENAVKSIVLIMQNRLNVPDSIVVEKNYNLPLTGSVFKFNSINLVYLLLEIENEIQQKFDCNELLNYNFNSISSIAKLVVKGTAPNNQI